VANDRISQVPVEVIAANVPVPPPAVTWRTVVINTPSSPGSGSVSSLDGQPKALIFYGTNWTTEDTVDTSSGLGMFRGMAGPKFDDASIVQNAACIVPPGDAHAEDDYAILALDNTGMGTSVLYRATVDSFDTNGFSYTFDVTSSGYKVLCLALMDDDTGVSIGSFEDTMPPAATFALGFKAGASLYHGAWAGPVITGDTRTQEFYGGGVYPGVSHGAWEAAWLTAFVFPTSSSGQTYNEINANQDPTIISATGGHFTGPFLITSNMKVHPGGIYLDELQFSGDSADGGMVIAWNDEDSETGFATPGSSVGNTTTVSGLPFEPGLLIGYTLSSIASGGGTGGIGAAGFYVVTQDIQWCATVQGSGSPGAFQSFQRGFCDTVAGTDVHAGTVELTQDGFVMTTVEDDATVHGTVWQVFGHPRRASWIPHIYRRTSG
jgi:hypothetical protein